MNTIRRDVIEADLDSITGKEAKLSIEQRRAIIAFFVERHRHPVGQIYNPTFDPEFELELIKKSDAYLAARLVAARDDLPAGMSSTSPAATTCPAAIQTTALR